MVRVYLWTCLGVRTMCRVSDKPVGAMVVKVR